MKLHTTFVASSAKRWFGVPLLLALATGCSGDGDAGAPAIPGNNAALRDQGAPFNSEPAALGGTDSSRRASFDSTPTPSGLEACAEHCGGACGGICMLLCAVCPNIDLARCLSVGSEERGNEGEGGDQCEVTGQACIATYGCALPEDFVEEVSDEER